MVSDGAPTPSEPPVESHEWLLRHFPNDPSEYDFDKKFIRYTVFTPRKSDDDGLSLSREGSIFVSAEQLLASARNIKIRQFGGVCAVLTEALLSRPLPPTSHSLTVEIRLGDTKGHVVIPEINRPDWELKAPDGTRPGKQKIQEIADAIVRLADKGLLQIRIQPSSSLP